MPFHTVREITIPYGKGGLIVDITIPSHTRVVPCPDTSGEFFVDDLSWIDRRTQGMTLHDATYYGIRLPRLEIEEVCP